MDPEQINAELHRDADERAGVALPDLPPAGESCEQQRVRVPIDSIRVDPDVMARTEPDAATVDRYAETLRLDPDCFPPVDVFKIDGAFKLADGVQRIAARKKIGLERIATTVHEGGLSEARGFAAQANLRHGLLPTAGQKTRAVSILLLDAAWRQRPDQAIAEQAGVSPSLVRRARQKLGGAPETRTVERAGKTYTMRTGRIGGKGPGRPSKKAKQAAEQAAAEGATTEEQKAAAMKARIEQLLNELGQWFGRVEKLGVYGKEELRAIVGGINAVRNVMKHRI